MNAWILLILAGMCEIGWPLGLKMAQNGTYWVPWLAFAGLSMGASGWLLFLAQKSIVMGTAYAVWTGIGAAGAFAAGVLLFHDPLTLGRALGVSLIVGGVLVLKTST